MVPTYIAVAAPIDLPHNPKLVIGKSYFTLSITKHASSFSKYERDINCPSDNPQPEKSKTASEIP